MVYSSLSLSAHHKEVHSIFSRPKEWESNEKRLLSLLTAVWSPVRAGREMSQKPAG